ncbi:alpha,alpha-trehalose-phosphate synthase [UDP-forming] 1-like [Chenopodium quinoa]|uniref:alpha,alpha-trehalose-phosphate synthase [UDP-forming] 1-like n=1 Tax=Chenopodium quinoa TaxID=63459 RepID=UPI000B799D9A|nr:alpha,alpha-trehalose-phosphate synthase [UDP-forming] 1-like [Chenopodium quinoa]
MPGNKYNGDSKAPTSRISRLLELRQLKRANMANNEISDDNNSPEPGGGHDFSYVEKDSADAVAGSPSQRLIVVANRLPVSAVRKGEDSWSLEVNVGGLVSALLGVKEFEARWIGWAGVNVPDEVGQKSLTKALAEKRCIPVFLDEELVHQYYNGYCNNILWPLFHYLGLPQEDRLATTRSSQSQLAAYKKANQMFADVVNQHYKEGDIVWCHDYHLMFLPECLKRHNSKMKVGWFLHTPFPSSEIHRTLPSRSELLRAVLAADLVGFHTYDYARHFVSSCTHILGLEGRPEGVEDDLGRLTRVVAFPIGIDSDRFIRALKVPQVQGNIKELVERFGGQKVILGVDRLDMIKGIPQKILAFEKFLEENPYWRDRVVLLQIAVPTRTDVIQYQKLTSQVHEIVGRINGRFGTYTRVPIYHLDRSLDFHALCALYAVTDVALVTSLRDGMNLVSYEFVACQDEKKGVLILSEFAGAAQSLGAGALLVNPWNITEVADAIGKALNMSDEERTNRHQINFSYVTEHTAQEWAEFIVSELNVTVEAQLRINQIRPVLPVHSAVNNFLNCSNRLLILGFNAALTEPINSSGRRGGDQVKDMNSKLNPELKGPLSVLCNDSNSTIVILSGSRRIDLFNNFGEYDMWLAAEHGMFLRHTRGDWKTTMPELLNLDWVPSVYHIFEYFKERTPRSTIELRDISVVWNYKYADIEFGKLQARDMLQHLWTGPISNTPVEVVPGSTSVEVRPVGITKGSAIDLILGEIVHSKPLKSPIDYVICIGHFLEKDEDVYTFFEPELPNDNDSHQFPEWPSPISPGGSKASHGKTQHSTSNSEEMTNNGNGGFSQKQSSEKTIWNILDLKKDNYFSCAVGRTRTCARYTVGSSDEVVSFLTKLAEAYMSVSSSL